jgi:hypothetical protein
MNPRLSTARWALLPAWFALASAAAEPTNAPAPAAAPPPLPLEAPEFRAIKESFERATESVQGARMLKLRNLLKRYRDDAEAQYKEREAARNIRGMAVATAAKMMFAEATAELDAKKEFALPDKVRRELEPTLEKFRAEQARIESEYERGVAPIEDTHFARFCEAAAPHLKAAADPAALRARFRELLRGSPPPPKPGTEPSPPAATNVPAEAVASNLVAAATNEAPTFGVFALSGTGDQWVAVARWTGQMMGMDVIRIPVMRQSNAVETTQFNLMSGRDSTLKFEPLYVLPLRPDFIYRLKQLPDMEAVTVLEWPRPENDYVLVIRTQTSSRFPCPHGFEIQVSLPGAEMRTIFPPSAFEAAEGLAAPSNWVTFAVQTMPSGAVVFVDGVLSRNPYGAACRTPCEIKVAPGVYNVRLALPGYLDMNATRFNLDTNRLFQWVFRPDVRVVRRDIKVSSSGRWTATGVKIAVGDRLTLQADGQWSCGSKKEKCGPGGYPSGKQFYHYYLTPAAGPRQAPGVNYGALLLRIGEKGAMRAVGESLRFTADADGMLYFDINETDDGRARLDNSGALDVRLLVMPPAMAPPPEIVP